MEYLKENITNYFSDLTFEETEHKYYLNNNPINYSVSGLLKQFAKEFNSEEISKNLSKRTGVPQNYYLKDWKSTAQKAQVIGTATHLFAEKYLEDKSIEPQNGLEKAVVNFWKELPQYIVPLISECKMYHKGYSFAGTSDLILYNTKNGGLIIADYKTNKNLFKNYAGQKMFKPFSEMLDNSFNKYQLQLSFYQMLLEQVENTNVIDRKIIHLKEDGNYIIYSTRDFTENLKQELKTGKLKC